jgi:hypothetical protein
MCPLRQEYVSVVSGGRDAEGVLTALFSIAFAALMLAARCLLSAASAIVMSV